MDELRAYDQGAHTQHAIERRNNVGNRAPDGEGKIEPQELGHKAFRTISLKAMIQVCKARLFKETWAIKFCS
jgi:hypothetical protein